MKQTIVAISIDKVQTFLYHIFQSNIQENQTNSGTLKNIINASNLISKQFYKDVETLNEEYSFGGFIKEEFLKCSGSFIFSVNLEKYEAEKRLQALFKKYYKEYKGQLFLNYLCFEKNIVADNDKLAVIKESKEKLKSSSNEVIQKNSNLLFNFIETTDIKSLDFNTTYNAFSRNIDDLIPREEAEYNKSFHVAIVKADLDGIGSLFSEINNYNEYSLLSEILSNNISIDSLHKQTEFVKETDNTFKIYPLYVAGDDIFFAVPTSKLILGIKLCENIMNGINLNIKKLNDETSLNLKPISMSIGIDFAFNNEPIRYYYDRVQQQLDIAKASDILKIPYIKLCINEYVFYKYNKNELNDLSEEVKAAIQNKSNWGYFLHTLKLLNKFIFELKNSKGDIYEAHHFLYSLLDKITDDTILSSDIKYSNAVLYHLIPKYIQSPNRSLMESELLLIESLIQKVMSKKAIRKREENELCFDIYHKKQFETFIRLLLLFSDDRFNTIYKDQDSRNFERDKFDFDIKRIRSTNFNKTVRYLYEKNLYSLLKQVHNTDKIETLRKVFVIREKYEYEPSKKVEIYRTLNISNSMLFRIKDIDNISRIGDMIQASNESIAKDINEEGEDVSTEQKSPQKLSFNKDSFIKAAFSDLWTKDYIDSLLILYKLNELSIKYKIRSVENKKENKNKKNYNHNGYKKNSNNRKNYNKNKGVRK